MPINPSAAGRVRRGKGEGDTPWSNIIAFPPSSKDLCSLFFFFSFSFFLLFPIGRSVELGGRDLDGMHPQMVARAARSLQSLPTIGIACETRGTRRSLRVSRRRFQLSTGCWNLYAVPVLFERKTMETMEPSRFLAIELAPICIYPERRFVSPLSLLSQSQFIRSLLSQHEERKRICVFAEARLEMLGNIDVCNSREGSRKSCIFNIQLY